MPEPVFLTLTLLTCLLVKHTIADYILQTRYMFANKGRYGHPGGLLHAAIHAVLTLPVLFIMPPATLKVLALILAGEFLLHYHIDWMKEQLNTAKCLTPENARFWNLHGIDQLLHGLTYVAIVAILFLTQPLPV